MGSWGHGIRDSDGAMDAIDLGREAIDAFVRKPEPLRPFLKTLAKKAGEGDIGVMALADELFARGVDLRGIRSFIDRSIQSELKPALLQEWNSPSTRRKQLLAFRQRLKTKPSPPKPLKPRRPATGPILEKRPVRGGRVAFRRKDRWDF